MDDIIKAHVFRALMEAAPNSAAQQGCVRMKWQMEKDTISDHDQSVAFARALVDGLTLNNWPV